MPKKKEDAREPATKADVRVVDQKVQTLDHEVNDIAIVFVTIERHLKEIKENMLTKADKNDIMNSIEGLAGEIHAMKRAFCLFEANGKKNTTPSSEITNTASKN